MTSRQFDELGIAAIAVPADMAAGIVAKRLKAGQTPAAIAAAEIEICGDRITGDDCGNAGGHFDDFAGNFMADNAWELGRRTPGLDVLDGQSRAAGQDAGDGFAGAGFWVWYLLDYNGGFGRLQYHCLHGNPPCHAFNLKT